MRLSSIDNVVVQEGIERVLQVCVRFIAVCRLFQQQENDNENENENENERGNIGKKKKRSENLSIKRKRDENGNKKSKSQKRNKSIGGNIYPIVNSSKTKKKRQSIRKIRQKNQK